MASASPCTDVEKELHCPICMEFLRDPVTLDCGHNFCKGCITQHCKTREDLAEDPEDLECPFCRARIKKKNFQKNCQLANVVDKIKDLSLGAEKEKLCARHKEKLNLFCKEDLVLVCVGCERSPAHQFHTAVLLEDAARECKVHLGSCLEVLRKGRERILENKARTEKESQDLDGQIEEKKTRTVAVFNQLHQFLEEQETFLLSHLEVLEKEIVIRREEHMARLAEKLTSLEGLIQLVEKKSQQPASELLQDVRRTLQRYEKEKAFEIPKVFPPDLKCRIREFRDINHILEGVKEQFPAHVTLDPDTAHPQLILSDDRKSVRVEQRRQALPNNPERFDSWPCVLGHEGFTAQRHFWEVNVEGGEAWAVGVARKSVKRKNKFDLSVKEGVWAIGNWRYQYRVLNFPDYTPLTLRQELKRIRVTLDCAEGKVVFSDADTGIHIYTHSGASFCGETLLPFFYVVGTTHLTISS